MIIALDIDDTITQHPPFFALLSSSLMAAGHQVIIITFREDRARAEADLRAWGISYTTLVTASLEQHLEHGVYEWKAAMCRRHAVDIFFEDNPDVLRHVAPRTFCLMALTPDRAQLPPAA